MRRFRSVLILAAPLAMGACATAPDDYDPRLAALRHRILRVAQRLAPAPSGQTGGDTNAIDSDFHRPKTRQKPTKPAPTGSLSGAARGTLRTILQIRRGELADLQQAGSILGGLTPRSARAVVQDNWDDVDSRAHIIKVLALMPRLAAERILGGMRTRLIDWGETDEFVKVLAADHPNANTRGYVLVQIVR